MLIQYNNINSYLIICQGNPKLLLGVYEGELRIVYCQDLSP